MSSTKSQQTIPVVVIGVTRNTVVQMAQIFKNTPYEGAAVLDMLESPAAHQYSAQNLGTVLYALHPRPRALVSGTAIERIVKEVREVWDDFVKNVESEMKSADRKVTYIPLSDFYSADGPPPPATAEYLMKRLDAVFRPEVAHK